jgi:hypothetical protein
MGMGAKGFPVLHPYCTVGWCFCIVPTVCFAGWHVTVCEWGMSPDTAADVNIPGPTHSAGPSFLRKCLSVLRCPTAVDGVRLGVPWVACWSGLDTISTVPKVVSTQHCQVCWLFVVLVLVRRVGTGVLSVHNAVCFKFVSPLYCWAGYFRIGAPVVPTTPTPVWRPCFLKIQVS